MVINSVYIVCFFVVIYVFLIIKRQNDKHRFESEKDNKVEIPLPFNDSIMPENYDDTPVTQIENLGTGIDLYIKSCSSEEKQVEIKDFDDEFTKLTEDLISTKSQHLPKPGFTIVLIESASFRTSSMGNAMIELRLKTVDGLIINDYLIISNKSVLQYKLGRFVHACRLGITGVIELRDLAILIVNKHIVVDVKHEQNTHKGITTTKAVVDIFSNDIFYHISEYPSLVPEAQRMSFEKWNLKSLDRVSPPETSEYVKSKQSRADEKDFLWAIKEEEKETNNYNLGRKPRLDRGYCSFFKESRNYCEKYDFAPVYCSSKITAYECCWKERKLEGYFVKNHEEVQAIGADFDMKLTKFGEYDYEFDRFDI